MFWTVLVLLFVGFVVMFLEVLLPYGISFTVGLGIVALAVTLMFRHDPQTGALLLILALPTAGIAAWWIFRFGIKLAVLGPPKPGSAVVPDGGDPENGADVSVCQTLRPTGAILWNHKRLAARTVQVERELGVGAQVRVVGRESIFLLVEPIPENAPGEKPGGQTPGQSGE
jgi:membrane-bound ClpP family serine protease